MENTHNRFQICRQPAVIVLFLLISFLAVPAQSGETHPYSGGWGGYFGNGLSIDFTILIEQQQAGFRTGGFIRTVDQRTFPMESCDLKNDKMTARFAYQLPGTRGPVTRFLSFNGKVYNGDYGLTWEGKFEDGEGNFGTFYLVKDPNVFVSKCQACLGNGVLIGPYGPAPCYQCQGIGMNIIVNAPQVPRGGMPMPPYPIPFDGGGFNGGWGDHPPPPPRTESPCVACGGTGKINKKYYPPDYSGSGGVKPVDILETCRFCMGHGRK